MSVHEVIGGDPLAAAKAARAREKAATMTRRKYLRNSKAELALDANAAAKFQFAETAARGRHGTFVTEPVLSTTTSPAALARSVGACNRRSNAHKEITPAQYEAGSALRHSWEWGIIGISNKSAVQEHVEGNSGEMYSARRLGSVQAYRRAVAALGRHARIVIPVITDDAAGASISVAAVAKRLNIKIFPIFRVVLEELVANLAQDDEPGGRKADVSSA
jgi:hypothetical protein